MTGTVTEVGALAISPFLMGEAIAQEVTKATYTDPEGRFSFLYPSDWEMDAPENRFTKTFRGNCFRSGKYNWLGFRGSEINQEH